MTDKEKYKMALEGIQEILSSGEDFIKMSRLQLRLQGIFPELAESEDERIRKEIIYHIQNCDDTIDEKTEKRMLVWLEKHGEHNSIEEPNFFDDFRKTDSEVEQKPTAWSEEDIKTIERIVCILDGIRYYNTVDNKQEKPYQSEIDWLKFFKDRVLLQPKQEWKQENTYDLTDFENAMMHIGGSFFGDNAGLDPNDTNAIKEQANILLELLPKQEWSEEDEDMINSIIRELIHQYNEEIPQGTEEEIKWLKNKLKSLRPQSQWKPSAKQIEVLNEVINFAADHGTMRWNDYIYNVLKGLREQLKKLREE